MSTTTTNLGLVKPELTDAADITAMNENWDKIDEKLHDTLPKSGGALSGSLTVIDNFNVNKTYENIEYKTYVKPINYSIAGNGDYSTGIIHYNNGVNDSQLMFNKDGIMFRDNVNTKAYKVYGQHNVSELRSNSLNRTTAVNSHDTNYTTYMARGVSLNGAETNPTANGAIAWTYG